MLQFLDLLDIFPFSKAHLLQHPLTNNKLFLTFLKSKRKLILELFHLLNKHFLIMEPFLKDTDFLTFSA